MAEILKIQPTDPFKPQPTEVTLKFDTPKEIEGKWGPQWMYTVIHNGQEKVIYATKGLHGRIEEQGGKAGDTFSIIRRGEGKETRWDVLHVNDLHLRGEARQNPQPDINQSAPAKPAGNPKKEFFKRREQYGQAWDMAVDFLHAKQSNADVNAVAFTFYKMAQDVGYDLMEDDEAPKA